MLALRTLALLALIGVSSSQTSDCSYTRLLNNLNITAANELLMIMRPVRNWTTPTSVYMNVVVYAVLDVNEKAQTFTSHIWTQMFWQNEFLTWDPSDFCGINVLPVPRSMLWIPDVTIQEDTSDTGSVQDSPLVSLYSEGLVSANRHQLLTSTCQYNLFLFPFDAQRCNITFSSFNYGADSLSLGAAQSGSNLTAISNQLMMTQGEWQLQSIEITNYTVASYGTSRSKLTYTVLIKRKPLLYVAIFIVPLFYLLVLDLASFFISEASGEKLSFKVTVLLSISVLLLILKDMLPSTEEKLPLMATYCTVVFGLVGISVLEAILVSFLLSLDGYCPIEAPSSFKVDIQLESSDCKEPAARGEPGPAKTPRHPLPVDGPGDLGLLEQILEEVKRARLEADRREKDQKKPAFYTRLAQILDYVFHALYFVTVAGFVVSMYVLWVQHLYNE